MRKIIEAILNYLKNMFKPTYEITSTSGETEIVETAVTETSVTETTEEGIIVEQTHYKDMVILLDNGHAKSTAGKRSPILADGSQFFEYEFNRDIVKRIAAGLEECGIQYRILVPEVEQDIKLSKRAERANAVCAEFGVDKCLLISVHANAGPGDGWQSGRGWSIYTTKGQTKSDEYATIFYEEAANILPNYDMTLRKDMQDGDPDYEENFTIIYMTKCPALLTENLFMNNKQDVAFLMSDKGRDVIAQIHLNAIKRICAA